MTPDVAPSAPLWVSIAIAVGALILGGGGVAALMKAFYDRRQGVEAHELAEDNALSDRWKAIIETQTEALIKPLNERLVTLEREMATLKEELASARTKYWRAIGYIRQLHLWISRHVPPGTDPPPPIPEEITEDV